MLCNLFLSSAESAVPCKKSLNMRDQGCLLPLLRHYIEQDEEQNLMVQLLLPKGYNTEVVQRLLDGKGGKRRKLVINGKFSIRMLDAGELQNCAKRVYPGVCDRANRMLRVCAGWISKFCQLVRACAEAPLEFPEPACAMQKVYVMASDSADPKAMPPIWVCVSDSWNDKEVCRESEEALKEADVGDKSYIPGLPDSVALLCLAYVPVTEHRTLALVSHKHRELVRSNLLLALRRQHQILEEWMCIFTSGNTRWTAFNPTQNVWRHLPHARVDPIFDLSDRESLAAGTHLLWIGRVLFESVCYKYNVVSNGWERGPQMVTPRCLFGSATCGQYAYVAGGFSVDGLQPNILNSAERYDSVRGIWESLPPMNTPRQKCSGFFMDGKFYVIGGKTRTHEQITSGEEYDPVGNVWRTIENMYSAPASPPSFEPSPLLVAVAGNELYAIDSSSNLLKVYEKGTNTWRALGLLPVQANINNGWGVAFKALGGQLFVIGRGYASERGDVVSVFTWRPRLDAASPEWQLVNSGFTGSGSFLYNCAVMAF